MAKLVQGHRNSTADGNYIPTKGEGRKSIKLRVNEIVLQVHWQETLRGFVAGVLTTERVLMVSADLDILASSYAKFDKGIPSISLTLVDKPFFVLPIMMQDKIIHLTEF